MTVRDGLVLALAGLALAWIAWGLSPWLWLALGWRYVQF